MNTWPGNLANFMHMLLFIALLCMGYEMSRPAGNKEQGLAPATEPQGQDWIDIPMWQRRASQKAVEKYAMAQEKKWRRWNEAMFERSV